MRRRVGVGAIKQRQQQQERYAKVGEEIASDQLARLSEQMEIFRNNLQEFAVKHKSEIKKNPEFRYQFQQMCASIGVDPIASSKGFWSEALGVGDFYYELAIKIIEICMALSYSTGGIISMQQLLHRLNNSANKHTSSANVSDDDVIQAIKKLKCLGNSFKVVKLPNGELYVQSVATELSVDHILIMNLAGGTGYVELSQVKQELDWDNVRIETCLNFLVQSGIVWIDSQSPSKQYWFPSIFLSQSTGA